MSFRVAGFACSKSPQKNVQEQEVSSSDQRQSQDWEGRQGKIEEEETPGQSSAQYIPCIVLDDDEEMEEDKAASVNNDQLNNNPRGVKDEKKEDLKKFFPYTLPGSLPRNLEMPDVRPRVRIKGKKQFYYCNLCHVQLSSEETMISHVSGTPHCKKLMVKEEAHREKIRAGLSPDEQLPEFVQQIPVPISAKTKIPKRLHERIRDSEEPIIGLQFITEILPESDPEMEPHYECQGIYLPTNRYHLSNLATIW